jgi:diguanylate cyclase
MRYEDSIERSAEYLRQALPHMSRQAAALHPISYAVWYEYVAGRNPALQAEIDRVTAAGGKLDENGTQELFSRHIAEVDLNSARRVTDGFQRVLTGMAESAASAGSETARFGDSLQRWGAQLVDAEDASTRQAALDDVLSSTRQMHGAVEQLQARLKESQTEIQKLRDEVARARDEAMIDSLTGLANRRAFDLGLAASFSDEAAAKDLCLVMLDIDHFKRVNDTYGHLFGDQVIRAVAQVLRANVKGQDLAARVGGEEFAILLPATPLPGAHALAEKIRATIASSRIRRQGQGDTHERVTVSLGVARLHPGELATSFMDRADTALYASKNAGRDRVTIAQAPR